MATIYVDGDAYQVNERHNLLEACLQLGFDLPYFCWHPAMGSVGACRQCAVRRYKDEDDDQGSIVMACMSPAADGTRLSVHDEEARDFRASVIEWLMANHPHDCPVCAEGGECHLQDMTVMTGHNYRRFRFGKRTHRNQYLGPFIAHEMNRCIACYRCTRFYREYAGGDDLDAIGMHDHVYFGRHRDGTLENEFSGNLVEVCPTGVFTDKPLTDTYTRKWDLRAAPSVCIHCGVGCNISPGERYGAVKRVQNRYNGAVNGYFLCDRGRFGYDFVNLPERLRTPAARAAPDRSEETLSADDAAGRLRELLGRSGTIGIGSPRATLETNHALREAVGAERFHDGMDAATHRLVGLIADIHRQGGTRLPSLTDMENADAVLVLGEDLTNTAPRIALSLRQTVRNKARETAAGLSVPAWHDAAVRNVARYSRTPLYLAAPHATRLDDAASQVTHRSAADIARLGAAVAHALDASAPAPDGLDEKARQLADQVADTLREAERPLVVSGCGAGSEAVIRAAANVARALGTDRGPADLCLCVPEANSLGVALMGGGGVDDALAALENGDADSVVIAENDLYERAPRGRVDGALGKARNVVLLDALPQDTADRATLILPAATFAESDGTLVSYEGRAQRLFKVMNPEGDLRESWRWLAEAAGADWFGGDRGSVTRHCAQRHEALSGITEAAPDADFREAGEKVARAPMRYSGRTAMAANKHVQEAEPPRDPESPLAMTMEGRAPAPEQPGSVIPYFWAPRWNSVQAVNKFQAEIAGPLAGGDAGERLLEPDGTAHPGYLSVEIPSSSGNGSVWRAVPVRHIFGSDPLSRRSRPLAERVPEAALRLHPDDAEALGAARDDTLTLEMAGEQWRLPVRPDASVPHGTAGVPIGLPGGPAALFAAEMALRKEVSS